MKKLTLTIILVACSEADPVSTTGQTLKGSFVLTKAEGHELMHVGGPDLDDPIIIRRVPTTYVCPVGTAQLELGEGTFYLDAPMPVQLLKYRGKFRDIVVEETNRTIEKSFPYRYYKEVKTGEFTPKLVLGIFFPSGYLAREYGKFPYEWIGDTLKLDFGPLRPDVHLGVVLDSRQCPIRSLNFTLLRVSPLIRGTK